MGEQRILVRAADIPADRRRGGELRVLLGPRTVGSTSGFLGVATLAPGERIAEHYHPYSEEFLYVCRGEIIVDLDGEPIPLSAEAALFVPIRARHRLRNVGDEPAEVVFHLSPLAPRPELGHVDTEGPATAGSPVSTRVPTIPEGPVPPSARVERSPTERAPTERTP